MVTSLLSLIESRLAERSYSFPLWSNWLVLIVGKLVSKEMTHSDPYIIENGVSLVDFLGVVRYTHRMWGNSLTYLPFASSSLFSIRSLWLCWWPQLVHCFVARLGWNICSWSLTHNNIFKKLCCPTGDHCPRWKYVVRQTLWQYFAKWTSSHPSLGLWKGVPFRPTW